ncbi:MAG: 7-cyano-7-deazaguanine synthase [Candidatus Binataceae bacterium]
MKRFQISPLKGRVAVLASGGLDSSVMLAELARRGRRVFPLYIRAGLKWERQELSLLKRFIGSLKRANVAPPTILNLPTDDARDHWSVSGRNVPGYRAALSSNYIVGRNLSLLTKAAIFCARNRIGELAIASLEQNPFPDATPEFFRSFERTARLGLGLALKVATPYAGLSKAQVIRRGRGEALELTLSCARPVRGLHCGRCTKCAERLRAFREARVVDPIRYAHPPGG